MNAQNYLYNLTQDKYKGLIPSIIKFFLFLLSLIYGLIIRVLIFFYSLKPYQLNCKVISVGNITLGGTGKTTLVEFIAKYLRSHNHKVAILTRGYKRKITDYQNIGDEPYMLQMNLKDIPVIVDADRIRGAKFALSEYGVDTIILDDGFQQWRIAKALELVAIDVNCPLGNRLLLPRGMLREPISSLKRADLFVLTKANLCTDTDIEQIKNELNKWNHKALIVESSHKPLGFYNIDKPEELFDVKSKEGKTVTLFSGIGDPYSFENLIASLGIRIGLSFRFNDHHNYTRGDLDKIIEDSKNKSIDTIITTQKDAARLYGLQLTAYSLQFLVLRIELAIKDEKLFSDRLLKLYSL